MQVFFHYHICTDGRVPYSSVCSIGGTLRSPCALRYCKRVLRLAQGWGTERMKHYLLQTLRRQRRVERMPIEVRALWQQHSNGLHRLVDGQHGCVRVLRVVDSRVVCVSPLVPTPPAIRVLLVHEICLTQSHVGVLLAGVQIAQRPRRLGHLQRRSESLRAQATRSLR